MNTTERIVGMVRRRRRSYSEELRVDGVAACLQPDMSMAALALSRGLNATLPREFRIDAAWIVVEPLDMAVTK